MLTFLGDVDGDISRLIFQLPHPFFFDWIFSLLSGIGTWGLIWVIVMVGLLVWEEVTDRREFFSLILVFLGIFIFVDTLLKNIVKRARPDVIYHLPVELFGYPSTYSFPSSHAALAFAGAYILSKKHAKWKRWYYLLAILIAFSRVYLGYHYIFDVVSGGIIGIIIGYASLWMIQQLFRVAKRKSS